MNIRNNIVLDQYSFNKLIKYAENLENKELINFIKNFSDRGYYFTADFNLQGELSILARDNCGFTIGICNISVDGEIESNTLFDLLFHPEQRILDYI